MSKREWALVAVIVLELVGGAIYLGQLAAAPRAPMPDLTLVEESTAGDLRRAATGCRSAEQWRKLAVTCLACGFFSEADACYRQAVALGPSRADLHYDWAFLLSQMGRLEESNQHFHRARALGYPQPNSCWYFVGRIHLRQNEPEKAAAAFAEGKQLPANTYELARILYRQGKLEQARALVAQVQVAEPKAFEPNFMSHRIEQALGRAEKADRYRELEDLAQKKLPTPFMVEWLRLEAFRKKMSFYGQILQAGKLIREEKLTGAAPILRRILKQKWDASAADQLSALELRLGHNDEAVRLLQEILARQGPTSKYLFELGLTLDEIGRPVQARAAWTDAIQLHTHDNLADPCFYLHKSYERDLKPDRSTHYAGLLNYYLGVGKFREWEFALAEEALTTAVKLEPTLPQGWFYLGEARRWLGKKEQARAAYERCLQLNPQHGRALLGLERLKRG